jgi:hypothetical protein
VMDKCPAPGFEFRVSSPAEANLPMMIEQRANP